jgi:AraC-like DNA-binding protein
MNITLAADDYIAKPFNIQEAITRINNLLGITTENISRGVIEGKETRRLERLNASMTTASTSYDDDFNMFDSKVYSDYTNINECSRNDLCLYSDEDILDNYSMNDFRDRQLMKNIEQYVLHNMSRGQINLEEMASAMGMGRVPLFHKIRSMTNKTPTELIRELRLRHACTLLTRTNINLDELAINVGFMTAENFTNIFKDRFGVSPLEYRLVNRNKK